jgi:hypothetical protein
MTTTLNASTAGAGGFIASGDNSGVLALQTAGTTAVTVDASQNVGIGTASPVVKLNVVGSNNANNAGVAGGSYGIRFENGVTYSLTGSAISGVDNTFTGSFQPLTVNGSQLGFATGATERMRITSTGQLLLGATSSNSQFYVNGNSASTFGSYITANISGGATTAINAQSPCSTHIQFYNSGTGSGSITVNGGAVSYNTSSDYRLKENIAPMTGALAKVAQLKPVTYKWKLDGADGQGFIAHELQEIVPNSVTGAKDAVDADGNPKYQGIDTSYLVATLTAAIQELSAKNDALTARIVALEAK